MSAAELEPQVLRGRGWVSSMVSKAFAEFVGVMLFHFVGSTTATYGSNAAALMVLVYWTAKISGGHLNPAVTLVFMLLGHCHPLEMLMYWFAQVTGGIVGAAWILVLTTATERSILPYMIDGCVAPHKDMTHVHIMGWEAIATFCFIVPIFSVVWFTQNKSGYGNTGPLIVGLSLYAASQTAGPWTGASLNPARAVASAVVFRCRSAKEIPWYVLGEMIGAAVVPVCIVPWYGISANPWYQRKSTQHPVSPIVPPSLNHNPNDDTTLTMQSQSNEARKQSMHTQYTCTVPPPIVPVHVVRQSFSFMPSPSVNNLLVRMSFNTTENSHTPDDAQGGQGEQEPHSHIDILDAAPPTAVYNRVRPALTTNLA